MQSEVYSCLESMFDEDEERGLSVAQGGSGGGSGGGNGSGGGGGGSSSCSGQSKEATTGGKASGGDENDPAAAAAAASTGNKKVRKNGVCSRTGVSGKSWRQGGRGEGGYMSRCCFEGNAFLISIGWW